MRMMAPALSGTKEYTAKRAAWPRMPTIMVVRQPSFFSVAPRTNMVRISAIWPMLMIGVIHGAAMPTPPSALAVPKKVPVQLK